MTWSFPIGRLFGSELRVHATFFLLLAWIGAAAWANAGPQAAIENVVLVVLIFACVIAHEFGHALTARRFGIETPDITLLPIGGLARLQKMPEKPGEEVLVALAGPAVNIVIWGVLVALGAETQPPTLTEGASSPAQFLGAVAAINLFLAVFNLIPAFPMDGGRVLRALLSYAMDRVTATQIAAGAGQVVAFGFGFLGLTSGNVILILIAIFIFLAAMGESGEVALKAGVRGLMAREAMITSYESLSPDDSLQIASHALIRTTQHEFPVLDGQGKPLGFLTRNTLFSTAQGGERAGKHVADVMITDVPAVGLTSPLDAALDALHQADCPAVAVTDGAGHMLGYITRENIGELMVVRGRGSGRAPV